MVSPSHPAGFGRLYSEAMADAAERLRLAEQYIQLRQIVGQESHRSLAWTSCLLLSQVCRIVADCSAPDFGVAGIVYDPHDPDDEGHCAQLFGPYVRKIVPVDICQTEAGALLLEPASNRLLNSDEIQRTYDRLYAFTGETPGTGIDGSDSDDLLDFARTAHERLFDFLHEHVVALPEWGGVALVRFREARAEQTDWLFLQGNWDFSDTYRPATADC